jgi:hypothetical protein
MNIQYLFLVDGGGSAGGVIREDREFSDKYVYTANLLLPFSEKVYSSEYIERNFSTYPSVKSVSYAEVEALVPSSPFCLAGLLIRLHGHQNPKPNITATSRDRGRKTQYGHKDDIFKLGAQLRGTLVQRSTDVHNLPHRPLHTTHDKYNDSRSLTRTQSHCI